MSERGLNIAHTTIMRWVHQFGPELDKRIRPYLKNTTDFWRVDETYIKVRGERKYLYRAVDSKGDTIDFILNTNRNVRVAKRFFRKALSSDHTQVPRIITVDKNPTYPSALEQLINESVLKETVIHQPRLSSLHSIT